jgi:hypothetical protein
MMTASSNANALMPGLSRVDVAASVPVMAAISTTGPSPPRNCHRASRR